MPKINKNLAWLFIVFLLIVVLLSKFESIRLRGDSLQYYTIAHNLINGNGYSKSLEAPYKTHLHYREPVYPFLIMLGLLLFKNLHTIVFIQLLLHMATAFIIYKVAVDFMDKRYATIVSGAVLLFPTLINYSFQLLTETVFTFLLVLSVYFLYFSLRRQKTYLAILSALVCGISLLTKGMIMLYPLFLGFMCGLVFIFKFKDKHIGYKGIKQVILFLLVFSIIMFSWHGYKNHFYPGRDNRDLSVGDRSIFPFVVRLELTNLSNKEMSVYALSVFSEKLVALIYPEYGNEITTNRGFYYSPALKRYKDSYMNAQPLAIIYEVLKTHPFKFIITAFVELIELNMFFHLPALNFNPNIPDSMHISLARGIFKLSSLVILFFAIKGMILMLRNKHFDIAALFLIAPVLYLNSLFIFMDAIPRYSVPFIPFYLLFCIIGLVGERVFNE